MARQIRRNTNTDLQGQLKPLIDKLVREMAGRLRKGLPVGEQERKLQQLWLMQQAAPYWKREDFIQVRTFLSLSNG